MSSSSAERAQPIHLKLPATSANLGSGFDAAAVALSFHLEIEAKLADRFEIKAAGRNADRCGVVDDNLIFNVYSQVLEENSRPARPLSLQMKNEIPLGMGCGSSAAGRLAGIALAVHFGELSWSSEQIIETASRLEGHPDNIAACWLGGFVTASCSLGKVHIGRVTPPAEWRAIIALPPVPLATSHARAILPDAYTRADVVHNIQAASLLGLAFSQASGDLLQAAMQDVVHQPYRLAVCPMLPRLLPLAGRHGILGVALSGAGPAVLVVVEEERSVPNASAAVREALAGLPAPELLVSQFPADGVQQFTH